MIKNPHEHQRQIQVDAMAKKKIYNQFKQVIVENHPDRMMMIKAIVAAATVEIERTARATAMIDRHQVTLTEAIVIVLIPKVININKEINQSEIGKSLSNQKRIEMIVLTPIREIETKKIREKEPIAAKIKIIETTMIKKNRVRSQIRQKIEKKTKTRFYSKKKHN